MSLQDRMQQDLKEAMRAGQRVRLDALRLTLSELKRAAIDARGALEDAAEVAVLQRALKQRHEAAAAFDKGRRPELAAKEREEAEILSAYLPRQLDEAELEAAVREAIQAIGATSAKDLGKVIGKLLQAHRGRVDGERARQAIAKALG